MNLAILAILAAKSALAMMLLVAGGAKLADLGGFAATVRMFVPRPAPRASVRAAAVAVALGEVGLGAASVSFPAARWVNPVILALACVFLAVSAVGYARLRGRSCQCFGALSQRKFDSSGVARAAAIVAAAALAMAGVRPPAVQLTVPARAGLLAAALVVALTAFTAARALATTRRTESRLTAQ
jgi:hypothetical protein